jgi:NAD(P)-dependent dehydrogenase (short-subunit alcohol dehydrogenase family)
MHFRTIVNSSGMENHWRSVGLQNQGSWFETDLVETPLTRHELEDPAIRELFMAVIPMKRAVDAEEIAGTALFLASDHARSINGETIRGRRYADPWHSGTVDRRQKGVTIVAQPTTA